VRIVEELMEIWPNEVCDNQYLFVKNCVEQEWNDLEWSGVTPEWKCKGIPHT